MVVASWRRESRPGGWSWVMYSAGVPVEGHEPQCEFRFRVRELSVGVSAANLRVGAARARAAAAAQAAAGAQEQAAASMERLANLDVPGADRLRDVSTALRQRAQRRRQWASDHAGSAVPARRDDGNVAIVVRERDRIAAQLQDTVVRRVFSVALTLHGAAGLTTEPEVRRRVEAAIEELDHVVRGVREVVFAAGPHAPGGGLDLLDLGGQLAPAADICFTGSPGGGLDPEALTRLRGRLFQALALIGEYATSTRIDIVADGGALELVIQAACLPLVLAAGEGPRWLADVRARATQTGISVDVRPEDGTIRLGTRIPAPPEIQGGPA
jgi:hypothetical protein